MLWHVLKKYYWIEDMHFEFGITIFIKTYMAVIDSYIFVL